MSYDPEREIERYLKRLSRAARDLPRARRRELVSEIEQHIRQALAEQPDSSEAEMLTLLDQVGDPAEIVAAANGDREGPVSSTRMETAAIVLLLAGGFLWGVGWLVGVVLLWSSSLWTRRDKLLGTLVVPGGLATGLFLLSIAAIDGGGRVCTSFGSAFRVGPHSPTPAVSTAVGRMTCTGGPSTVELVGIAIGFAILLIAPIATSIYLGRRLNKHKRAPIGPASATMG